MSDTQTEEAAVEIDAWLGSVPLLITSKDDDVDGIIESVRSQGFSTFYVLAELESKTTVKGKHGGQWTEISTKPRLLKVVSNLVGHGVTEVDEGKVGLGEVDTCAYFTLPAVPYDLINDIDEFFREVDRKYSTEAVVILTYDPEYKDTDTPSDGWGVLVPEQKNSAGSCDYDPTSVIDDKPDEVFIVGSAHSHPGMQAYCSGVDARDQANFDGLHVTYGWKNGSKQTEFYIELQMGGGSYTMKPDQVFTKVPEPVENERIQEWTKKVSKKYPTGATTGTYGTTTWYNSEDKFKNLPDGCPTPDDVTLIVAPLLKREEFKDCLICEAKFNKMDMEKLRCYRCKAYIQPVDVDYETLIKDAQKNRAINDLDIQDEKKPPGRPIWYWREDLENGGDKIIESVFCMWKPTWWDEHQKRASERGGSGKVLGRGFDASAYSEIFCEHCSTINFEDDFVCFNCHMPLPAIEDQQQQQKEETFTHCTNPECGIFNFTSALRCVFCDSRLESTPKVVRCVSEYCDEPNAPEDEECFVCGTPLPLNAKEPTSYLMPLAEDIPRADPRTDANYLCCDQPQMKCKCSAEDVLPFDTADRALLDSGFDVNRVYQEGTDCLQCKHLFSGRCQPYRGFLRSWVIDGEISEPIEPCDDYEPAT